MKPPGTQPKIAYVELEELLGRKGTPDIFD
jgi:hypothetical protein